MVDALDSKSSFFGSVGSIPTQGTDKQLQGSPKGCLFASKGPSSFGLFGPFGRKGYRRSLLEVVFKMFAVGSWPVGPASPTVNLVEIKRPIKLWLVWAFWAKRV